jgi:hypothetical protein
MSMIPSRSPPPALPFEFERKIPDLALLPPLSPSSVAQEDISAFEPRICSRKRSDKRPRRVTFSSIAEIRTHDVILGDHPFCRGGMALACGWAHGETELVDLDVYDAHSQHRRMPALHLSFYARRDRLLEVTGMKGHELLREEFDMCCRKPSESNKGSSGQVSSSACKTPTRVLSRTPNLVAGVCA